MPDIKTSLLFVSNYSKMVGGGEHSLFEIIDGIMGHVSNIQLVVPGEGEVLYRAEKRGVRCHVIDMPNLKNPLNWVNFRKTTGAIEDCIKRNGIRIVHVNASARAALYCGIAAKQSGALSVWHVRILEKDVLDSLVYPLYDMIIANSAAVKNRFCGRKSWNDKVRVIHNSVDTEKFTIRADLRRKFRNGYGIQDNELLIGVVGRLVDFKGHRYFVDAASMLSEKNDNVRFVIVGDGPLRYDIEQRSKRLVGNNKLIFTGEVLNVEEAINGLDIHVLPSIEEHFGRVVIEAMACGVPVVATNAGGVPEIIEDGVNGILVPPKDSAEIADAVQRLIDDRGKRESLCEAGRITVRERFTQEVHAKNILNLYKELEW